MKKPRYKIGDEVETGVEIGEEGRIVRLWILGEEEKGKQSDGETRENQFVEKAR